MARASEGGYDVFLSFSGNDTRRDFVRLLRDALVGAKLRVFLDESEIKVGDEIAKKILRAIDDSKIYIPIISETYPDSKWCLIELAHMMNDVSQAESSKRIFPIFYKLKPAEVEARTPRLQNPSSEVELRAFKEALAKVGGIKGWKVEELQSPGITIKLVVQKVSYELHKKRASQTRYLNELHDLTPLVEGPLNQAIERHAGRGSLSRGNIERSPSRTSTQGRGSLSRGNTEKSPSGASTQEKWKIKGICGMRVDGIVRLGMSQIMGNLSIDKVEVVDVQHNVEMEEELKREEQQQQQEEEQQQQEEWEEQEECEEQEE